jgi:8-oxo-dGTP diphosphatase
MSNFPSLPELPIRLSARAVIVKDGAVLLVKFDDEHGPHYNWPGGGQRFGESVEENLHREVWEEVHARIEIQRLFCIYEHLVSEEVVRQGQPQSSSMVFLCNLLDESEPQLPTHPDPYEVAVEWIPIDELQGHWVLPDITAIVQAWYHEEEIGLPFIVNREEA